MRPASEIEVRSRVTKMRYAVLGLCVFATACAGQGLTSPMSPSISIGGAAVTEAHDASELPFKGTLETVESIQARPQSCRMS